MDQNEPQSRTHQETQQNQANNEEKEMKAKRKYYGKVFVALIFFVIIYVYYIYVYQIMWTKMTTKNMNIMAFFLVTFHILLFMMLWSLLVTMNTHPGEIPLYWGFYIGDEDYKRKRYCLICNAFKPERSHHCSVCNICVLNMDHHCPWVDNCIGFYNRKYFMQLLFYLCLLTIFVDLSAGYDIYKMLRDMVHMQFKYSQHLRVAMIVIGFGINLTLSFLISMFFKFHLNLVLQNSTTIESLDKDHQNEYKKFNISKWENWVQVFGDNICLWFFPIIVEAGRPRGDGLTWKTMSLTESFKENTSVGGVKNPNVEMRNLGQNYNYSNYATNNQNNYNSTSPFSPSRNNNV